MIEGEALGREHRPGDEEWQKRNWSGVPVSRAYYSSDIRIKSRLYWVRLIISPPYVTLV